jgi:hypothetical protein
VGGAAAAETVAVKAHTANIERAITTGILIGVREATRLEE